MTPEAERFLQKARQHLGRAQTMLGVGLYEDAGRATYLAGFHAAQALIFERTTRVLKTHGGVQTEFLRLTKGDANIPAESRAFLSQAYNLKAMADYETGPDAVVTAEKAESALETARRFVLHITGLLSAAPTSLPPEHPQA